MRKYILILMSLLALSCTDSLAELEIVEFGAALVESPAEPLMPLGYKPGEFKIMVVSDGEFTAEIKEGKDWLDFEGSADTYSGNSADEYLTVYYDPNRTILRAGKIVLTRKHRKVEIEVSQVGILSEDFSIENKILSIGAEGGFLSAKVMTLASPEDIIVEAEYVEENQGEWISQLRMDNNYLKFNVLENPSEHNRHAVLTVSKRGTSMCGKIQVSQNGLGVVYEEKSIAGLREMATETPMLIDSHIRLTDAIVLNDNLEGNGAENRNVTATIQDLTLADRTLYVSDGNVGLKLEFAKGSELMVRRFEKVDVDLYGATLKKELDPERYMVTGISAVSVLKSVAGPGPESIVKKKMMSELEPSDVYTLVELTDCEIPIRKGSYMPINLKHYCVMNKYPMVIRDKEGSDMHMMVNTTCSWNRSQVLPHGSGSITGIIVHEHCDNFEWDQAKAQELVSGGLGLDYVNDLGDIGPYQIRPVSKDEIRLSPDFNDGFSDLICEFRYSYSTENGKIEQNTFDKVIYNYNESGVPVATLRAFVPSGLVDDKGKAVSQSFDTKRDWTMVGPCVDGKLASVEAGNGVVHKDKLAYWFVSTTKENNAVNEGRIDKDYGSAWSAKNWSYDGMAWQVEFNTLNHTAANAPMSVQFGIINGYGERIGGPTNWTMEYYDDASETWKSAISSPFTVPDFSLNGNKQVWNCPGHKYMSFTLSEDIDLWGKTSVKLRLRPYDKSAGALGSYDGGMIENLVENSLNYFAVRCNK